MKLQLDPAFSAFYLYFMNSRFDASGFLDVPILVTSSCRTATLNLFIFDLFKIKIHHTALNSVLRHELKFRFTMVLELTGRVELTGSKHTPGTAGE